MNSGLPFDVQPSRLSLDQVNDWILTKLVAKERAEFIVTLNSEIFLLAHQLPALERAIKAASLVTIDGRWLQLCYQKLGWSELPRVTGADLIASWLTPSIFSSLKKRPTLYVVGGLSEAANQAAAQKFEDSGNFEQVWSEYGPQIKLDEMGQPNAASAQEMKALSQRIETSRADLVLIGFGAPKQEIFINEYLSQSSWRGVAIGIGGGLDFISDQLKRAPRGYRALGLEWLYRVVQQPSRLERLWRILWGFYPAWRSEVTRARANNQKP